jgi:hypothetical protein
MRLTLVNASQGTLSTPALVQSALGRMSPSAERALLPTSRGKDDECALVPTALLISPNIRRLAAQRL